MAHVARPVPAHDVRRAIRSDGIGDELACLDEPRGHPRTDVGDRRHRRTGQHGLDGRHDVTDENPVTDLPSVLEEPRALARTNPADHSGDYARFTVVEPEPRTVDP